MLPRYSLPRLLLIGALALTAWAFVVVKSHMDGSSEMVGQYHRPLAGVLRRIPERQFIAGHEIASNDVPLRFGRGFRQASSPHGDGSSPATPGYFERARILLYLLRSRHWRKAAPNEPSQADCRTWI